MSDDAAEQAALRLKERGNAAYRQHEYGQAVALWNSGLDILDDKNSPLGIALRSNVTVCLLKMGQHEDVNRGCTSILEVDPDNVKVLARRSAARENLATARGSGASYDERKMYHSLAEGDLLHCMEILIRDASYQNRERLMKECEESLERLKRWDDAYYTRISENHDGKPMESGLMAYLAQRLTPLPEHPRIPMSSMKYEMLAVRLLASMEVKRAVYRSVDGEDSGTIDFREEGRQLLNKILTTVAQVPFCLFPATGSGKRSPPITVHLLAFYMRAVLSEKARAEFGIEDFCRKATSLIVSDEEAYAIATHGYREVEDMHNPMHGHGKSLGQSAKGCMPCTCRLTREGKDDFGAGLQQACHFGCVEGVAFCLNRLIEQIDGGRLTVVKAILEKDQAGCNAMMHAANDKQSGLAGLSIRMLIQAVAFVTPDAEAKEKNVRTVLNTADNHDFSPALASVTLMNESAMDAFVHVGARLWDAKVNGSISQQGKSMVEMSVGAVEQMGTPQVKCLIRALKTTSEDRECCSYCGNSPEGKLLNCGRCVLAKYCNRDCQKKGYKRHKFVCTTAQVDGDANFYAANISAPRP